MSNISEEDLKLLRLSSAFDAEWYSDHYPDVVLSGFDPAFHFLCVGWQEKRQPSRGTQFRFDLQDYLVVHPHVVDQGVHPVAHYLAFGINKRPTPEKEVTLENGPLMPGAVVTPPSGPAKELQIEADLTRNSPLFDPQWYVDRYPEAVADGFDPRRHFLLHSAQGYDPSPYFSSNWYLTNSPDVRSAGVNPLVHYLRYGYREGRSPHPSFDVVWYRRRYLAESPDVEPAAHFLTLGQKLAHRPHPLFDAAYFLDRSQDVRGAALDPHVHWMKYGRAERQHGYDPATLDDGLKVGVVAHIFDEDLWPQLEARLRAIPLPFELIVTVAHGSHLANSVRAAWPAADVIEMPRGGRDIGPFLRVLPLLLERGYDVACKLYAESGAIEPDPWRHMLLEGVLGNPGQVRQILAWFKHDPDLAMVGAGQLYLDGPRLLGPNATALESLFRRLEGQDLPMPDQWGFFAGSMFWIRPRMLRSLLGANLPPLFDEDKRSTHGRTADAVERLFGLIAATRGRRIGLTDVSGAGEMARRNPAPGLSRERPWLAPPDADLGITFVGPVEAVFGLGVSARGYVDAAIATGVRVHVIKWRAGFSRVRMRDVVVPTGGEQAINIVHLNLDLLHLAGLLDEAPLDRLVSPNRYNIVIVLWELMEVNPDWVETIHRFDEIWVPSSFMARAMQSVSAIPVRVVRPALSPVPRETTAPLPFQLPHDRCIFFYAADFGSVVKRKNPEAFWRAYAAEFRPSDGAFCVVKLHYANPAHPLLLEIAALAASRPDMLLVTDSLSDAEMASLFAGIDCYVSPHRTEGLGLTLLEAMLAGKPVIATGYSGESDFVREDTALLVNYDLIEVGEGAEPYMADAVWADPRQDSLRRRMRQVVDDRETARAIGARGRERALKLFSLEQTSARLEEEIMRIWRTGGGTIEGASS